MSVNRLTDATFVDNPLAAAILVGHDPAMSDSTTDSAGQAGHPARHVPISTAARIIGVNERTIRRWVSAGRLPDMPGQVAGQRVRLVDLAAARLLAEASDISPAGVPGLSDNGRVPAGSPDVSGLDGWTVPGSARPESDIGLGELARVIDRLTRENIEMAGRLGFYQSEIQHLQGENAHLRERIALLEAPTSGIAAVGDQVNDQAPSETGNRSASVANGDDSGAECPPPRPWWKFWERT